jgi:GT2 family glycosyltransferase
LPSALVTVVVPTLAAGDALADCLRSLEKQTLDRFEVIVVDNSGEHLVKTVPARMRVLSNDKNLGFGAAINQGIRASESPYIATLNDDAVADPQWLQKLVAAAEARPKAGMCASEVHLAETAMLNSAGPESATLDSAGMLIAIDGSSKQRGHGEPPQNFSNARDALCPSGSAALYRRTMLDQIGLFDETFFLYCEDTDLGLRAQWAGWECAYVPGAIVEHRYSHSAGRASPMKAYFVERNRLYTAIKNFPWPMLLFVKPASFVRYFWHFAYLLEGRGKASEFRDSGHSFPFLLYLLLRAWIATTVRLPRLWRERRRILKTRRITRQAFRKLLADHSISLRHVAQL